MCRAGMCRAVPGRGGGGDGGDGGGAGEGAGGGGGRGAARPSCALPGAALRGAAPGVPAGGAALPGPLIPRRPRRPRLPGAGAPLAQDTGRRLAQTHGRAAGDGESPVASIRGSVIPQCLPGFLLPPPRKFGWVGSRGGGGLGRGCRIAVWPLRAAADAQSTRGAPSLRGQAGSVTCSACKTNKSEKSLSSPSRTNSPCGQIALGSESLGISLAITLSLSRAMS